MLHAANAISLNDLLILAVIGIAGTGAQMLLAQALKEEDTGIIMPFDFLKLIWAVLIGYLVFSEIPAINVWIGGIIIFSSTLYVAYRERIIPPKVDKNIAQPADQ